MNTREALAVSLILSVTILSVELIGGLIFRSTALIADALHVATDILAILFSFIALMISSQPPSGSSTYGYHRIEVVASLVNGLSLVGIVIIIMYTAYTRLINPQQIDVVGTISFATIALALNIASSRILANAQSAFRENEKDLNVSSAQLHILGDALASLAVIIGALAISFTGQHIIDPLVAIFIGLIVLRSAIRITKQGGAIILERSPIKNLPELLERLQSINGVSDVHDFHVWRICSHIAVASLHACLNASGKEKPSDVRRNLENRLNESGVQHVTIQLEEVCCIPSHGHKE
jgi:cobalt-zinc-cadmium efflux system protein